MCAAALSAAKVEFYIASHRSLQHERSVAISAVLGNIALLLATIALADADHPEMAIPIAWMLIRSSQAIFLRQDLHRIEPQQKEDRLPLRDCFPFTAQSHRARDSWLLLAVFVLPCSCCRVRVAVFVALAWPLATSQGGSGVMMAHLLALGPVATFSARSLARAASVGKAALVVAHLQRSDEG